MKRVMTCLFILVFAVSLRAVAAETGLDKIEITPANPPETAAPVLEILGSQPGFLSADWDTALGAFVVTVEDSIRLAPRDLIDVLGDAGVEVDNLRLHFKEAQASIRADRGGQGYMYSTVNDMEFCVLFTTNARRLWDFLGRNPRGPDVVMSMSCDLHLGAADSSGAFAPDSASVVRFRVANLEGN